jgi:hypothetical protein
MVLIMKIVLWKKSIKKFLNRVIKMNKNKFKQELKRYFEFFSDKNIDMISKMFSDEVSLVDWNISAFGKKEVLKANENIFQNVESIEVTPIEFYSNSDTSYSVKISIIVDEIEKLEVIDVIKFDENGLIKSIEAYKNEI